MAESSVAKQAPVEAAYLLVNTQFALVRATSNAFRYFKKPAPGRMAGSPVFSLARRAILDDLRRALQTAACTRNKASRQTTVWEDDGSYRCVEVRVKPALFQEQPHFLITLEITAPPSE